MTAWELLHGRDATGCNRSGDISVCIIVRCDSPGTLNIYFEAIEGDPFYDRLVLSIDGQDFPVALGAPAQYAWGFGTKIRTTSRHLLTALERGRVLRLKGADMSGGIERFALAGAGKLIGRVRARCASAGPAP